MEDIFLDDDDRKGHFWCFGTTRVGKTRLIENMIEQDIIAGRSVVVIDPKGDNELASKIIQVAVKCDRVKDIAVVNPIHPQTSLKINPLRYFYMEEEIVANIMAGVETGSEPFFYGVSYETVSAIVSAVLLIEKAKRLMNLETKKEFIVNYELMRSYVSHDDLKKLVADLLSKIENMMLRMKSLSDEEEQLIGKIEIMEMINKSLNVSDMLIKIINSGQDYYNKISSSLRVALVELCGGNIGGIIGNAKENKVIQRLENDQPVILIVQVGSLLTNRQAFTTGKVIISMLGTLVGRRFFDKKGSFKTTINLYIDEAQNVLYQGIDDLFAKAGGAGLRIHGFCQSVSQIYDKLGQDKGNAILDNTNTKLYMRVPDEKSAKTASDKFGDILEYKMTFNTDSDTSTLRDQEVKLVEYTDFMEIGVRDAYMVTYKGKYKFKSALTTPLEKLLILPSTTGQFGKVA